MELPDEGCLLRIYIGESDEWEGGPLYEALVLKARELHMAGATVLRGPIGYGANSRLHANQLLRLSEDLPIVIEIVDSQAKIDDFLPQVHKMVREGLVTLERVQIIRYRAASE
jgi:PII-like signaling protein